MAMICFLNGFLNTSELNKSKNGAKARIQKWFYAPPTIIYQMCFSVEIVTNVKKITPSPSRCVE